MSRALVVGMSVTGLVYITGSLAAFFAPELGTVIDPFYVIPLVVETAFAVRLVTRGLRPDVTAPARPVPVSA